jgi:hypothetical protein
MSHIEPTLRQPLDRKAIPERYREALPEQSPPLLSPDRSSTTQHPFSASPDCLELKPIAFSNSRFPRNLQQNGETNPGRCDRHE